MPVKYGNRRILRIPWSEYVSNEEVLSKIETKICLFRIRKRKLEHNVERALSPTGHIESKTDSSE